MAKADRGDGGRFVRSEYSIDERYDLVAAVARKARPDAPLQLTMKEFNDAAAGVAAKKKLPPKPPRAQTIYASLHKSWPTIVKEALDSSRNVQQTRAANERSEPALHLDERYIVYALRRVAMEIGEDFSEDQYDAARRELIRRHERHPGTMLVEILPTSGQVLALADNDWNKARRLAGLPVRKAKGRAPALPLERLIEHFFETKGRKPKAKEIRPYGNDELGIAVPDPAGVKWHDWLERTRAARAERGLSFDDAGPREAERLSEDELSALIASATPRSRWGHWNEKANVLAGLVEYVSLYDRRADLRQGHYIAVYAGKGWPPLKAIDQHYGGFQAGVKAARSAARRVA
ncbi:MAG TPA: hypothetical protein VFA56_04525 [Gaiellaceae bacterium]|nr:hypothetical protein [Gaiellaceae bacterium]